MHDITRIHLGIVRVRPEKDGDLPLPAYMSKEAAGMDICAGVEEEQQILPGEISVIPTGFAMALPLGYEAQIRPRSGLAAKHGITLVNSPGTIDSDYRGEVLCPMINLGKVPYTIRRGDRIAQMIISPVVQARVAETDSLQLTPRGKGGFGHTGR